MKRNRMSSYLLGVIPIVFASMAFGQFGDLLKKAPEGKKVAHFRIAGKLSERPREVPLLSMFEIDQPDSLKSIIERMKQARGDASVKAIVVDLERAELGFGQIEELRAAMASFAAVDKEVFVHADMLVTPTYALACGASHISVTPTGDVLLLGLHGESPYFKDGLEKLGLTADMEHCGDFKAAHEHFTRTGPSPEALENVNWLLDGMYDGLVKMIAEGRKIPLEKVKELIDNGPYTAEEALAKGLIDSVQHRHVFAESLKSRFGDDVEIAMKYGKQEAELEMPQDPFGAMTFFFELINPSPKVHDKPSIGVVYVEGMILPGEAEKSPFSSDDNAYSTTIRKALDKAREDDSVKAIVLRVNSPGGSALASEIILDAARRAAAEKPLVVSMGDVAASGGYYVSCAGGPVFADNCTITGSIGVVGGKFVTTGGWKKLGVNWSQNQRGKMASMFSSSAPFNEAERAKVVRMMNDVYGKFKGHVVEARKGKLTMDIDKLAGGRVYTGAQAKEKGLVDQIGSFDDAVKHAAKLASISDYEIRVIPEPPTILEMFNSAKSDEYSMIRAQSDLTRSPLVEAFLPALQALDPKRVQAFLRTLACMELIQREGVVTMLPADIVID